MTASIPFMLTQAQKASLRARGLSNEEIAQLTPADAHRILNTHEAIEFLEALRPEGPWVLTAINRDDESITTRTLHTAKDITDFVHKFNGKRNIYFAVNPTRTALNRKASKVDVAAIEYLLGDLDPRQDETSEAAKARYRKALETFSAKPTGLIDSGNGLQGLWRVLPRIELELDEPKKFSLAAQNHIADAEVRSAVIMKRLGARIGTQNIDRVLRLPGTINLPNAKKREQGRVACQSKLLWFNGASYKLEDFPKPTATPTSNTQSETTSNAADPYFTYAREIAQADVQELVEQGAPQGDRSDFFHAVVCRLLEGGWSREDIVALLQRHPRGIAEKYRKRLKWAVDYSFERWSKQHIEPPDNLIGIFIKPKRPPQPFPFINIGAWKDKPIPPRDWIVDDVIPAGPVTGIYGDGGTGKTILMLQLATAVIVGCDWLNAKVRKSGSVLAMCCEDDTDELHRRMHDVAAHYGTDFATLEKHLRLASFVGEDALLAVPNRNGILQPTKLLSRLQEAAFDIRPRFIGIDNATDVFGGNENDRGQVRQFINTIMRGLALKTQSTVVMTAHPSAAGLSSGSGTSGSTTWSNSFRSRLYFRRVKDRDEEPDPDVRELEVKKLNYGRIGAITQVHYFNGVFVPLEGETFCVDRSAIDLKIEEEFLQLLDRFTAQGRAVSDKPFARNYAPTQFSRTAADNDAPRRNKRDHEKAMERLFTKNKIRVELYGRDDRDYHRVVRR